MARNARTAFDTSQKFIGDLLQISSEDMVYGLTRFILEVRKKNGNPYPSEMLYKLIMCLQMYCHMYGKNVKFLDDPAFVNVKNILNNEMKHLSSEGFNCPRQKADAIEIDDENSMWKKGILGDSTPKLLVDTLLYLLGVHFALRAGKEHKSLRVGERSQLKVKFDHKAGLECSEYTEDSSKNNQGGIKHRKITEKVSHAYENKECPEHCVVCIYKKYMSLCPKSEKTSLDFYLRPLVQSKEDCWYTVQPMGIHKLSSIVSDLASKLGLQGKFTNHSCCATCATCMYQNNCDEQLVQERTGHRSNAVRSYKRTSDQQL